MAREAAVLKNCLDYLAMRGIPVMRNNTQGVPLPGGGWRPAPAGARGSPDIISALAPFGRALFVECKGDKGRQSPEQRAWQAEWERVGALYVLARDTGALHCAVELALREKGGKA